MRGSATLTEDEIICGSLDKYNQVMKVVSCSEPQLLDQNIESQTPLLLDIWKATQEYEGLLAGNFKLAVSEPMRLVKVQLGLLFTELR